METEQVRKLLEKFFNGGTSLEEEEQLREYFLSGEVAEEFLAEREYFLAMRRYKEEENPPSSFAVKLESLVDDHFSGTMPKEHHLKPVLAWSLSVAASLLILAGAYFAWMRPSAKDTYSNPQTAYMETRRVLLFVSQQLNKGTGELTRLEDIQTPVREMSRIQKTTQPVNDLKYLNNLSAGIGMMGQLKTLSHTQQIMNKYLKINETNK